VTPSALSFSARFFHTAAAWELRPAAWELRPAAWELRPAAKGSKHSLRELFLCTTAAGLWAEVQRGAACCCGVFTQPIAVAFDPAARASACRGLLWPQPSQLLAQHPSPNTQPTAERSTPQPQHPTLAALGTAPQPQHPTLASRTQPQSESFQAALRSRPLATHSGRAPRQSGPSQVPALAKTPCASRGAERGAVSRAWSGRERTSQPPSLAHTALGPGPRRRAMRAAAHNRGT
jgi:hypothetical protein